MFDPSFFVVAVILLVDIIFVIYIIYWLFFVQIRNDFNDDGVVE